MPKYKIIGNKKVMDKEKGQSITTTENLTVIKYKLKKDELEKKTVHLLKMIKAHQMLTKHGKK